MLKRIRVSGDRLVADGSDVRLMGYNLGGWMNMENFLTGYPGTESQHRRAIEKALGTQLYERFFEEFYRSFVSPRDIEYLASIGMNSVRIPFHYRHFEDDDKPFELKESGFALLDGVLDACERYGVYAVLDLHSAPGWQSQHWHCDNPGHWATFWQHRHFQDRAVNLWQALATRYRDRDVVAGYNLLNEPGDSRGETVGPFYQRTAAAIREIDHDHVLFLDGNRASTDFRPFEGYPLIENAVYSAHDYKLPGFYDGGHYPGVTRGIYVDRDEVERGFLQRTEFMRETGTPIWIGEFGPVFRNDPTLDAERLQLLRDQLSIYQEHGASWAMWAYKDIGNEGVIYARPDSPWLVRLTDLGAKKARLGVDRWGSTDEGIRELLEPAEAIFEREFADFDPFPFGGRHFVHHLMRHIMLAEPMVEDFGRCLEGITQEAEVVALARSFAFENCAIRDDLEAVLKEFLPARVASS